MTPEAGSALGRIRPPVRTAALLGVLVLVGFIIRVDGFRNTPPPSLIGEPTTQAVLAAIGALAVGLVGLIARRLGGDAVGYGAALVVAIYPAVWTSATSPAAEALVLCGGAAVALVGLVIVDVARARRGPSASAGVAGAGAVEVDGVGTGEGGGVPLVQEDR